MFNRGCIACSLLVCCLISGFIIGIVLTVVGSVKNNSALFTGGLITGVFSIVMTGIIVFSVKNANQSAKTEKRDIFRRKLLNFDKENIEQLQTKPMNQLSFNDVLKIIIMKDENDEMTNLCKKLLVDLNIDEQDDYFDENTVLISND